MISATIDELRDSLMQPKAALPPEYVAKMMHRIPEASVVDRSAFILERVTGRRVLELGATGPMHAAIVASAACVVGIDRDASDGVLAFDLDDVTQPDLPPCDPEIIVCGEVLEHLANPGHVLARLKAHHPGVPIIITVPNAFSDIGRGHVKRGTENVNKDHVSYYSYKTLTTLVARYGFTVREFAWYNGDPRTAEGLIVVVE